MDKEVLVLAIEIDRAQLAAAEAHLLSVVDTVGATPVFGPEVVEHQYIWIFDVITGRRRPEQHSLPGWGEGRSA